MAAHDGEGGWTLTDLRCVEQLHLLPSRLRGLCAIHQCDEFTIHVSGRDATRALLGNLDNCV
jgi:hypothetical protein